MCRLRKQQLLELCGFYFSVKKRYRVFVNGLMRKTMLQPFAIFFADKSDDFLFVFRSQSGIGITNGFCQMRFIGAYEQKRFF